MAYSVFISYSTRDLEVATALKQWITAAGAEPFLAEYSLTPGRPLATDILEAIKRCDLFLLLWSTSASASEWVEQEIGAARAAGKPIMPVVLHDGLQLPGFINDLKYLPLYRDPNAAARWLHTNLVSRVKDKKVSNAVALALAGALLLALLSGGQE